MSGMLGRRIERLERALLPENAVEKEALRLRAIIESGGSVDPELVSNDVLDVVVEIGLREIEKFYGLPENSLDVDSGLEFVQARKAQLAEIAG